MAPRRKPELTHWRCPECKYDFGQYGNCKRHVDKQSCGFTFSHGAQPESFNVPNPNYHSPDVTIHETHNHNTVVHNPTNYNHIVNNTGTVNITNVTQTVVFPLGSREEIERGLQFTFETLDRILEEPIHMAITRYFERTQCSSDLRVANVRIPNKGSNEVEVLKKSGVERRRGKPAYLDLEEELHVVLGEIVLRSPYEMDSKHEYQDRFPHGHPFQVSVRPREEREVREKLESGIKIDKLRPAKNKLEYPTMIDTT